MYKKEMLYTCNTQSVFNHFAIYSIILTIQITLKFNVNISFMIDHTHDHIRPFNYQLLCVSRHIRASLLFLIIVGVSAAFINL